jgi:uracil-DNA glycosylase
VVDPEVLVCLGATAVKAVIGPKARVMKDHGQFVESKLGRTAVPTLHPSAVLRAEDEDRKDAMALLVADLAGVREHLAS